eukprot:TRINITY_DN51598_c0_g1_i1.p2 TRINITY_DN51598_c0_g1~~TRINITY_DN51598_c0_g1_i1.p2  ORF type:complete len:101 (-),score=1.10 TRINITY_DN51598_c0_g1_i1:17-319(-)
MRSGFESASGTPTKGSTPSSYGTSRNALNGTMVFEEVDGEVLLLKPGDTAGTRSTKNGSSSPSPTSTSPAPSSSTESQQQPSSTGLPTVKFWDWVPTIFA